MLWLTSPRVDNRMKNDNKTQLCKKNGNLTAILPPGYIYMIVSQSWYLIHFLALAVFHCTYLPYG